MYQLEEKNLEENKERDTTVEAIEEQTDQNELVELDLEGELGFDPLDLEIDLGLDLLNLEEIDPMPLQDPSPPNLSPKKDAARGVAESTSSASPNPGSLATKNASESGKSRSENILW